MERGPLIKSSDKVTLETIRGEPVQGMDRQALQRQGVVYALVNGKRSVEMAASKQAGLGAAMRTPVTHSPLKQVMLVDYVEDLFDRVGEYVIEELAKCPTALALEEMVASDADDGVKKGVANIIVASAGVLGGELPTFAHVVEAYGEPLALEALKRKDMSLTNIADQMALRVVNEVANQMQASYEDIESFYRADQLLSMQKRIGASAATRTIFSAESSMAKTAASINAIKSQFPTAKSLQRTLVANALQNNSGLVRSVISVLKNAIPPKQRQRIASRYAAIGPHYRDGREKPHGGGGKQRAKPPMRGEWSDHSHHHRDHRGTPSWASYTKTTHRKVHASIGASVGQEAANEDDEETQARVRMYIASGLVPPQFRPFDVAAVAAPSFSSNKATNVAQLQKSIAAEPPSIVPYVSVASAVTAEPASLEPLGMPFLEEPPALEPIQAQQPQRAVPAATMSEPPSLEVVYNTPAAPVNARSDSSVTVMVRRKHGDRFEDEEEADEKERERHRRVREQQKVAAPAPTTAAAVPKKPATSATANRSPPPAFELRNAPVGLQHAPAPVKAAVPKKQPVNVPADDDDNEESLPSLDGLARLARAAAAIKTK
jgi:hypothetical protein